LKEKIRSSEAVAAAKKISAEFRTLYGVTVVEEGYMNMET
jgi:hypothetical protein